MTSKAIIPFNEVSFGDLEISYVRESIKMGHVSGCGPFTAQAESLLGDIQGHGRSLLTTSCSHALELASRVLNLGPGDEVIVPSFTFVTTASSFMMSGARPVFVDVRNDTLNVSPEEVEPSITDRTKAICIVNYAGIGAEPDRFVDLVSRRGLTLIEDNAHGLGGHYGGQVLGSFGSVATHSFHETKNISCGEGGALHLNQMELVEKAEILREKGTNRARFFRGQVDKYTWVDLGSSWVLSDMLAAVLVGQLERFGQIQSRRREIWDRYHAELQKWAQSNGVRQPTVPKECDHPSHLYYLRMPDLCSRSRFIDHMQDKGVRCVFHYQPLHLSEVGRRLGGRVGQCPVTEQAADDLVRLPLYASLSDVDLERVIEATLAFSN
jgi:dTDP-4-amino-4,6-dideoxygalactose transaminase